MSISLVTIVFDDGSFDADSVCKRIADVNASGVVSGLPFELVVIDNSPRPIREIQNLACDFSAKYQWCDGYNTYHGQAMNIAARLAEMDAIVYFCSGHCEVLDHSWLTDIVDPLADPLCGIAGSIGPCLYDRISADPKDWKIPQKHIQGAICAMRRELMLEYPYGNRFPHNYSDVSMCLTLVNAGYRLVNVPSVRSVGIGRANRIGAKIIHDYK